MRITIQSNIVENYSCSLLIQTVAYCVHRLFKKQSLALNIELDVGKKHRQEVF